MAKQFGLITRDKKATANRVANIFGSDSEEDEAGSKKKPRTTDVSVMQKKLAQKMQEEALAVDSKIFEYDEVYDEIAAKRNEEKQAKKSTDANKPKYITKLLETAEKRKKEHERRVERQVQKEREAEGEEFKDKESFVTSTYKKKLEEMKEAEEAEKREAYLENIGDVTKQQDISGFYRHIYEQKTSNTEKVPIIPAAAPESSKKKNYRKRKSSADLKEESDNEGKATVKSEAHITSNLDADSDFSIDSESDDEEKAAEVEVKAEKIDETPTDPATESEANGKTEEPVEVKEEEVEEVEPPKPKIDIWKKRTVDEVFDQAVERYYQRKAERERAA